MGSRRCSSDHHFLCRRQVHVGQRDGPRDPNYDSGNEQNGVSYHLQLSVQIKMYKQSVRASGQQPATEPTTLNMQLMSV